MEEGWLCGNQESQEWTTEGLTRRCHDAKKPKDDLPQRSRRTQSNREWIQAILSLGALCGLSGKLYSVPDFLSSPLPSFSRLRLGVVVVGGFEFFDEAGEETGAGGVVVGFVVLHEVAAAAAENFADGRGGEVGDLR